MHSSTSSSERLSTQPETGGWLPPEPDAPGGPYWTLWLLVAAVIVCVLLPLELYWRAQGHTPDIASDADLWCLQREQVEHAPDRQTVALLGASRMQLCFETDVFESVLPQCDVHQLAVAGSGPMAALRDLAQTETFRGTAIVSVTANTLSASRWEQQQPFVAYYRTEWSPSKKIGRYLATPIQQNVVLVSERLNLYNLLRNIARGTQPQINYTFTAFNRDRWSDYSRIDIDELAQSRVDRIREEVLTTPTAAQWREAVEQIAAWVKQIESRGGQVIFVRFPTSGEYRAIEDAHYPRAAFWDVFAEAVEAAGAMTIHYLDLPETAGLTCPEGSHLSNEDSRYFTQVIAETLRARGAFDS